MNHDPNLPVEYYQAVVADATRVATDAAYVAGRLRSAMEAHIAWLETVTNKLSERGITAEWRKLIIDKETARLREVLADAWISRT